MMFVFWGRAAQLGVGQEACGKARQDKRKAPYCWARDIMEGHTGRLPHICVQQSWRKYQSTQRKEKRKDALLSRLFFSPNKYSHICNWNLPRQFLPKSVQIVPKLITLFWKKCWNQLHKFGRNVEINDMVLEAAKWSELCGAKTPMMQRKGNKSLGGIALTNTQRH